MFQPWLVLLLDPVLHMISRAVDVHLEAAGAQFLKDLGVETSTDLAFIWSSELEILEATSDAALAQLTAAWTAARVEEGIRLAHLPPLPPAKKAKVAVAPQGARPKSRALPPASLLPSGFRFKVHPCVAVKRAAVADTRGPLLDLMFELALAPGSENVAFVQDLVACQDEATPIFERQCRQKPC